MLNLGDCLDPVTGLASLADKSVDVVITDPPYEAEVHTLERRVYRRGGGLTGAPLPFPPVTEQQRTEAAQHFARLARRWVLVFCQVEASHAWAAAGVAGGLAYRRTCIWVKPDGKPQYTGDRPGMGYEAIVALHAPCRSTWNGGGQHGVFIHHKAGENGSEPNEHPTQKPVGLIEKLVGLFTDPGDLILDPFAGSGTTGVAAIRLGRRFVGWELDPKYHAAATRRLEGTREQLTLFARPGSKPKQEPLLWTIGPGDEGIP
jgi:site-specific DNA-methyltransferase (adenine-specific)